MHKQIEKLQFTQIMPLPLVIVVTGENADVPNVVSIRACEKKKFQFKIVGSYFMSPSYT